MVLPKSTSRIHSKNKKKNPKEQGGLRIYDDKSPSSMAQHRSSTTTKSLASHRTSSSQSSQSSLLIELQLDNPEHHKQQQEREQVEQEEPMVVRNLHSPPRVKCEWSTSRPPTNTTTNPPLTKSRSWARCSKSQHQHQQQDLPWTLEEDANKTGRSGCFQRRKEEEKETRDTVAVAADAVSVALVNEESGEVETQFSSPLVQQETNSELKKKKAIKMEDKRNRKETTTNDTQADNVQTNKNKKPKKTKSQKSKKQTTATNDSSLFLWMKRSMSTTTRNSTAHGGGALLDQAEDEENQEQDNEILPKQALSTKTNPATEPNKERGELPKANNDKPETKEQDEQQQQEKEEDEASTGWSALALATSIAAQLAQDHLPSCTTHNDSFLCAKIHDTVEPLDQSGGLEISNQSIASGDTASIPSKEFDDGDDDGIATEGGDSDTEVDDQSVRWERRGFLFCGSGPPRVRNTTEDKRRSAAKQRRSMMRQANRVFWNSREPQPSLEYIVKKGSFDHEDYDCAGYHCGLGIPNTAGLFMLEHDEDNEKDPVVAMLDEGADMDDDDETQTTGVASKSTAGSRPRLPNFYDSITMPKKAFSIY